MEQENEPVEYLSGLESWKREKKKKGRTPSKTLWFKELANMPGVFRIGRNFYVPTDVIERLARGDKA